MQLSLRAKLTASLGVLILGFAVVTVSGALLERRVDRQLSLIRERYFPQLALGPALDREFELLRRSLQDAVAALDAEGLEATHARKDHLLRQLSGGKRLLSPQQASSLHQAIESYYASAYDVSRRLLAGETGEELVEAMGMMQDKHARAAELLKLATSIDQGALTQAFHAASDAQATANQLRIAIGLSSLALVFALWLVMGRAFLRGVGQLSAGFDRFGRGEFGERIPALGSDELGHLSRQANQMAERLEHMASERARAEWLKAGHAGLVHELRGELSPEQVALAACRFLAGYLGAPSTALYALLEQGGLRLLGHCAAAGDPEQEPKQRFAAGEGLVGRAAASHEIVVVSDLPANYLTIQSGLGACAPRALVLVPLVHLGRVAGVLELASLRAWSERDGELLLSIRETLAIALDVARARSSLRELLARTQAQADQLARQEEELRATNEELESQQDELRHVNVELTQRSAELEQQQNVLQGNNRELSEARRGLEQKAKQLSTVSAYKSQFLANMSHELRTPLNSMLLLSNLLAENDGRNLTDRQVEFCRTIHGAGKDLLALINQVLDLAKVEAGKEELRLAQVPLCNFTDYVRRIFEPLAREKDIALHIALDPALPEAITTDPRKVEQIINNLVGNAIKFTTKGEVRVTLQPAANDARIARADLPKEAALALSVADTGAGIPSAHQERVFAPFEQLEATSDRRYGGTGLGLTIARELANLLGGELQLRSVEGQGSTFTCYLPRISAQRSEPARPVGPLLSSPPPATFPAPRAATSEPVSTEGPPKLLVMEDDPVFAGMLREIVEELGLVCLLANDGLTGLALAKQQRPRGIVLDVRLSGVDGFTVMEALRADPATAAIPVHFVSALEAAERGLSLGAIGYLTKPASRQELVRVVEALLKAPPTPSRILIVERGSAIGESLAPLLTNEDLQLERAGSAQQALDLLARDGLACVVLELGLPDMDALTFLERLRARHSPAQLPVVVYSNHALSKAETQRLEAHAVSVALEDGPGAQRLLDEIRLFARRFREARERKPAATSAVTTSRLRLTGKCILVADDDMRTLYALSALLRARGAEVLTADTGRAALSLLAGRRRVDLVLMDIMMPEMDGYEAMRRIRSDPRHRRLPIIALTAKAMKTDRETCLAAGASEYLPKPVDPGPLFSLLQTLLGEEAGDGAASRS